MKNLSKSRFIPMIALMLLVGSSDLFAQGRGGGRQNLDPEKALAQQIKALTKGIDLTEEQVALVTPILQGTMEKQLELRKKLRDEGADRSKMREMMGQLVESQNGQMAEILSEEQMTKYTEWQKEQQNSRRRGRGQGRPGNRGN